MTKRAQQPKTASSTLSNASNTPLRPLSATRYAKLLSDVQRLVRAADAAVDHHKVVAQWNLGQRITAERVAERQGYRTTVLRDLAADLHLSVRQLQYAVRFHATYAACPTQALSWLHYRALLVCPTPKARAHYTQLALATPLNARQLAAAIASDKRGVDHGDTLPRPDVYEYVYRVRVDQIIDGDTLDLTIDLGYRTQRQERIRLAAIDCPELLTPEGRVARDFVYTRLMSAKTIAIHSQRSKDLHGRYIAHLYYSPHDLPLTDCITQATHLNAELLAHGHATRA